MPVSKLWPLNDISYDKCNVISDGGLSTSGLSIRRWPPVYRIDEDQSTVQAALLQQQTSDKHIILLLL